MNRRDFIELSMGITALSSLIASCSTAAKKIKGRIVGASASAGHIVRDQQFGEPVETSKQRVVIVGGGVSGLSAARHLSRQGINDFVLFDLENQAGGNAAYGQNNISAYPWGAHYIPVPNNELADYLDFLKECNVITGEKNGLPEYNENYLCFDPQERLYINGRWQDGLVPQFGVPDAEQKQIESFLKQMDVYRYIKGSDGKDAFAIPVDQSSKDEVFTSLDKMTMKVWMEQQGYTSRYLQEYINYCCRDDFGTPYHLASAWVGIHYFASRKGKAVNANHSDILTWPEGNGFLVKQLQKGIGDNIKLNVMVVKIIVTTNGVQVNYLDLSTKVVKAIVAEQCIVAVPQFVAARLLEDESRMVLVKEQLRYVPWMVANLQVKKMEEKPGNGASWDNVVHGSNSLGYVDATHEMLETPRSRNLTYYLPLTDGDTIEERKTARERTYEQWVEMILEDLECIHPNIRTATEEVNIMLWGHAMAQPLPGIIHGGIRTSLAKSIHHKIHFAHTDLAGISIFEEAFYQGTRAAQQVIDHTS